MKELKLRALERVFPYRTGLILNVVVCAVEGVVPVSILHQSDFKGMTYQINPIITFCLYAHN